MRSRQVAKYVVAVALALWLSATAWAEEPADDIRQLKLRDWQPKSMLATSETKIDKPRFPAVDVHNHLGAGKQHLTPERVANYLVEMNEAGVRTVVNLDGGWGERLQETLAALDDSHPGRFATFALLNLDGIDQDDWSQREAERLEASFRTGAKGLKFHKGLGLTIRYKSGQLMAVDDPKLDPIWKICAERRRPVMIHTADPAAFFTPLDRFNERWHELNEHPAWLFFGERFPDRQTLLDQLERVVGKNPKTTFIGAHFGNNAEDLASVGRWLDKYPNFYVDIDARISELGRQPYTARKFFLKYQDRIMFGTDTNPRREAFRIYYRFLETDDEYFDCAASHHLQGFWRIYGIYLPPEVLEKVYFKNAERVLFASHGVATGGKSLQIKTEGKMAGKLLHVKATEDFEFSGDGSAVAWRDTAWEPLTKRGREGHDCDARFKILYSKTGIYVLMNGTDKKVTATLDADFLDLWNEDVFEFFFWPDERWPVYFEYEISPLGRELPILVPNFGGKFLGWRPWHYEGPRLIRKAVSVSGGEAKSGATITGWTAEVFVPYKLLEPLQGVPPQPGTRWRANFYRVDYDDGRATSWDWARVGPSFHEIEKFGTLVFD